MPLYRKDKEVKTMKTEEVFLMFVTMDELNGFDQGVYEKKYRRWQRLTPVIRKEAHDCYVILYYVPKRISNKLYKSAIEYRNTWNTYYRRYNIESLI